MTLLLRRGDKIRWTQPTLGIKYSYIVAISYDVGTQLTTITIADTSNYSVANEAITNFYFSRESIPFNFPAEFDWVPTLGGFSADPSGAVYKYYIADMHAIVTVVQPNTGTSNSTAFEISAPISASTVTGATWGIVPWSCWDNGAVRTVPAQAIISSAGSTIICCPNLSGTLGLWTNANGKSISFTGLMYPI